MTIKRIKISAPKTRRVRLTAPRAETVDPAIIQEKLGGERVIMGVLAARRTDLASTIKCGRLSCLESSTVDLVTAAELSALLRVARAAEECLQNWPEERARNQLIPALSELKRVMDQYTEAQKAAMAAVLAEDL